jgi:Flp pilus assembly protein TadG
MPELTAPLRAARRPGTGRRRPDDRGAVATVVAILLAGGVLLGFLALVVDVGQIYVEREQLQSGADSAALAVAKACAGTAAPCSSGSAILAVAQSYADANAADGRSRVVAVCGRLAHRLEPCGPAAGNLTACLGSAPPSAPYVEVRLATELADGSLVLPPVFAQTMAGGAGFDGTSVGACARATWQPPTQAAVLGLTLSTCDWQALARNGFADPAHPQPRDERVIVVQPDLGSCAGPPPDLPWQRPGPAGWLAADGSCQVQLPVNRVLAGASGGEAPASCQNRLRQAAGGNETVYLPVYDRDRMALYHITAYAPFVVTGFTLGAGTAVLPSSLTATPPCPPNTLERCVSGLLVGALIPVSDLSGDSLVTLIG